ncbi:MAG: endonuclease [Prevotella sp.]|jgi:endonuclease/exonuclease/phosphatase family metal-dependent hydrolase|nr:endonuclease [Prevotella sp.]
MIELLLISFLTFAELNCENLFDTQHDSLKNDYEFLPGSNHHWTRTRYWRKLDHIGQEIIALGKDSAHQWHLPDFVILCEVENDSVMRDLTRRSLLRHAKYEYFITRSPDERGIDVALLYNPYAFLPIRHFSFRVHPLPGMRPTRDILYVSGRLSNGDTLHIFGVHAPSRMGGERASRPHRLLVERKLAEAIDSLRCQTPEARIIIAGDFNDYQDSPALKKLYSLGLTDISREAKGKNGAKGTYRFRGEWGSLDHILCSQTAASPLIDCSIGDLKFILEPDEKYGGVKPFRTYMGPAYRPGYSDHLPLVAKFKIEQEQP